MAPQSDVDSVHNAIPPIKKEKFFAYVGILTVYYAFGIFMYMVGVEKWSFTDAVYFITVTFTTAGFGVIVPSSDSSRAFTTFFICVGMVLLAVIITDLLRMWSLQRERMLTRLRKRAALGKSELSRRVAKSFSGPEAHNNTILKYWRAYPVSRHLFYLFLIIIFFAVVFYSAEERLGFGNAVYFAVVASTTIGYGDIHPNTVGSKWVIIMLLPPAVYFLSSTLSGVANYILDESALNNVQNILVTENTAVDTQKELGADKLLAWSIHNPQCIDGVTEAEYLHFILTKSGLVDNDTLTQLREKFEGMNPTNGKLSKEVLRELAEEAQLSGYDDVYKEKTDVSSAVSLNKMKSSEGLVDASDV